MIQTKYFQEIEVKNPAEMIMEQIKDLIHKGVLKPGDKLPSERILEQKFGVGRGYIREAIMKLEFFGIVKVEPQRGTIVAKMGSKALERLIANIIQMDNSDLVSLFETRAILEVNAARIAAQRVTPDGLRSLNLAHQELLKKIEQNERCVEEEHLFHLKIAEIGRNSVLISLISLITPSLINLSSVYIHSEEELVKIVVFEHQRIIECIAQHNPEAAAHAMMIHMERSFERRFGFPMKIELL